MKRLFHILAKVIQHGHLLALNILSEGQSRQTQNVYHDFPVKISNAKFDIH